MIRGTRYEVATQHGSYASRDVVHAVDALHVEFTRHVEYYTVRVHGARGRREARYQSGGVLHVVDRVAQHGVLGGVEGVTRCEWLHGAKRCTRRGAYRCAAVTQVGRIG